MLFISTSPVFVTVKVYVIKSPTLPDPPKEAVLINVSSEDRIVIVTVAVELSPFESLIV